jgi:hypothetical protein
MWQFYQGQSRLAGSTEVTTEVNVVVGVTLPGEFERVMDSGENRANAPVVAASALGLMWTRIYTLVTAYYGMVN